ncbi:MAG: STAS domain-containing protein [Terriglobales bacterium]
MESPSALSIRLPEYFNGSEARALRRELDRSLASDQPCMIVDFSNVKQMDTPALDMLLKCMVKIAQQDGAVQIGNISAQAATMLELTGMDKILNMFPRIPDDAATVQLVPLQGRGKRELEEMEEEETRVEEPQPLAA